VRNITDDRGCLLLTKEEWLARMKISGGENSKAGEKGGGKNDCGRKTDLNPPIPSSSAATMARRAMRPTSAGAR
jgi:hypothetical protein